MMKSTAPRSAYQSADANGHSRGTGAIPRRDNGKTCSHAMTADGHGVMAIMREVGGLQDHGMALAGVFRRSRRRRKREKREHHTTRPAGNQSAQRSNSRSSRRP